MQDRVRARLEDLQREYAAGQNRLRELEMQEARVRETVLRISGAIQVLEELLQESLHGSENGDQAARPGPSASAPAQQMSP